MTQVTLYGPNWSAYTRTVRMTLIEKLLDHDLVEVDFSSGKMPESHLGRNPFGKVPVLRHADFSIYETSAICRYIDTAFEGPSLQPSHPQALGRMTQIIAILDAYLSQEIRMEFVNQRLFNPMMGLSVDEERVQSAEVAIKKGFKALGMCIEGSPFLVGEDLTLADLHAAPLFDYLHRTPGGCDLIESQLLIGRWWEKLQRKASLIKTEPDLSAFM